MIWDAVIAGAGPAGAVAAHVLARHGRKVLLVDTDPKHAIKVGEALPGAALRLLRALGIRITGDSRTYVPIGGNLFCWDSEELSGTDFFRDPDGPGWRLDRLCFDSELRETAKSSGATFEHARVISASREGAGWHIQFDGHPPAAARWLINAGGRGSSLAHGLGAKWLRDSSLIALYGIGHLEKKSSLNRTLIEAVAVGWWYAGLLPLGSAMVGLHLLPRDAGHLVTSPGAWQGAFEETRHISAAFPKLKFEFPLRVLDASGGRLSQFAGDRWLACGDAAMSFDPISAQGIFSALHSGLMAAATVHKSLEGDHAAVEVYQTCLEEIRKIYIARCRSIYLSQYRWPASNFWLRSKTT